MQTLIRGPARSSDRSVILALSIWATVAASAAALGVFSPTRVALVPITVVGTTLVLVLAYRFSAPMRAFADGIDLRVPILFHLVRAPIGVAFLALAARGELDPVFAFRAGWGDVVAGLLAVVAAVAVPVVTPARRAIVLAWNVIGLSDIVMVFATAQSILFFSDHPETMFTLARFPYALIPVLVVPLVFATHFLVFVRVFSATRRP